MNNAFKEKLLYLATPGALVIDVATGKRYRTTGGLVVEPGVANYYVKVFDADRILQLPVIDTGIPSPLEQLADCAK